MHSARGGLSSAVLVRDLFRLKMLNKSPNRLPTKKRLCSSVMPFRANRTDKHQVLTVDYLK